MTTPLFTSRFSNRPGTRLLGLTGWLVLVFAIAAIGATATIDATTFYASLAKPDWAPPGWVFGPVWSLLYGLMGVAAWLIWQSPRRSARSGHTTGWPPCCCCLIWDGSVLRQHSPGQSGKPTPDC